MKILQGKQGVGRRILGLIRKRTFDQIYQRLETIWVESGAWSDFLEAMRQALYTFNRKGNNGDNLSSLWVSLPGLCCKTAGGDPEWTDDFTVAWFLFYLAADLMDDLQDQDVVDPWWEKLEPGLALNLASGLYFSASLALNNLQRMESTGRAYPDLVQYFYNTFLTMCSGQHRDLGYAELTLNKFWEIAAAKSGAFFSLACYGGARLATDDVLRLDGYKKFGHHLGMLIQILDDLEEINPAGTPELTLGQPNIIRSLPAVFALEVSPPHIRERLQACLINSCKDVEAYKEVLQLINQSGAVLYIETEIEHHRVEALSGLDKAVPDPNEREILHSVLLNIYPD